MSISPDCFRDCKFIECFKIPQKLQTDKQFLGSILNNRIIATENSLIYCSPYSISNYLSLVKGSISGFFDGMFYHNDHLSILSYVEGTYKRVSGKFSRVSMCESFYISSWVF